LTGLEQPQGSWNDEITDYNEWLAHRPPARVVIGIIRNFWLGM
jgi:hypothetical protein